MKHKLLFATILLLTASEGLGVNSLGQTANQTATQKTNERSAGSITGRVVNESGRPMPNARVFVLGMGRQAVHRTVITDEAGKYVADALPRGSYAVSAQANGYVSSRDPRDPFHYRPGETANLTLKRGAVITGVVTNSDGEPVVGVPISATRVRDTQGRPIGATPGSAKYTDDRGVYRIFGLPAGTYIVVAAPRTAGSSMLKSYVDDAPTYYPSSTRDTAVEVLLQDGGEASGIDILYRGEQGYAVSGTIANAPLTDPSVVGIGVLLIRASNDTLDAQTSVQLRGSERVFAFYGVPDGDYYLTARQGSYQSNDGAGSKRVPVKVRGHDVTGVGISLVPLGSIAGRLTLDIATRNLKCETPRVPSIEETLITVSTDETDSSDSSSPFASPVNAPDSKGDFLFQGLPAGRYLPDTRRLLDEAWYVRAVTVPGPTSSPVDASRSGIALRPGQRINGIRVVLGEGAASLRGRVVADKEGASLPDRLRVHLLPAEADSARDLLRFFEAEVQNDGSFKLTNLAPGRYVVIARQRSEEEAKKRSPKPLAWNATERANLRRLAQAANTTLDLRPCQRVAGYELRYTPPKEAPPKRP
ncbi:MAG TPA: carboxypeptidase-like regulatory domain-containing protein [Blastocatellia bacterium]|nr:carboxypeptidase-like regulatory domain-containing protein [Blastocatellia bacterium]